MYGDGSVTITRSDGATLAPTKEQLRPVTYAKVAALEAPNTLIAIGRQSIQRSNDAGCNQYDGIPSLAFNPADPSVLYLGLAEER